MFHFSTSDDCGVFTMKFMDIHDPRTQMQNAFSQSDIINLRIKFANQIYFSKFNTLDKTVVSEYFGDVCTILYHFWLCINLFFSSKFSLIFMFFSIGWDVKILANCFTCNDETQCPSSPLATGVGDALGFFLVFFYLHANVYGKLKTTNIFMSVKFVLCVFCNRLCSDVVCTKLLFFRVY
jgi:hypothetical protein